MKFICPKCKGKGMVRRIDWVGAIFILPLLDDLSTWYDCSTCDGLGFLEDD